MWIYALFVLPPLLATPAPTAHTCDRLVAMGAAEQAGRACGAAGGDLSALLSSARDAAPPHDSGDWPDRFRRAFEAAERARAAAPDRVVEEWYSVWLTELGRATLPTAGRPDATAWPLPGLALPSPRLPQLDDPPLDEAVTAIESSARRIAQARRRLRDGGPATLANALDSMNREHAILVERRLAALEDALKKDPKLPPTYWLHLAGAYFEHDRTRPVEAARQERGRRVLEHLTQRFPETVEARSAAQWLDTLAAIGGDRLAAGRLGAGPAFGETEIGWVRALDAWRRGEDAAARTALGDEDPAEGAAAAQRRALRAALTEDHAARALAWLDAADHCVEAEPARRARLRAAIAWAEAIVAGGAPERVPATLRRPALLHAFARGEVMTAHAIFLSLADAEPTAADLPALAVEVIDAASEAGSWALADRALVDSLKRLHTRWAKDRPAPERAAALAPLQARLEARLKPTLDADKPVDDADRERVGGLLDAWLVVFPVPPSEREALARRLSRAGYPGRATSLLREMRDGKVVAGDEASTDARLAAARALAETAIERARAAGVQGAPTGPWLDGAVAEGRIPPEARAVIDSLTALIKRLPAGDAERDRLVFEHALVRLAFGDDVGLRDGLAELADRRSGDELGLAAALALARVAPVPADRLLLRLSLRRSGHSGLDAGLRRTLTRAAPPNPNDPALSLVGRRLYAEAAQAFEQQATSVTGPARASRIAAAGASWALALQTRAAVNAWRRLLDEHPTSPHAPAARRHLADLLERSGDRPAAAAAWLAVAEAAPEESPAQWPGESAVPEQSDPARWPDAPAAFRRAAALRAADPGARADLDARAAGAAPGEATRLAATGADRLSPSRAASAPWCRAAGCVGTGWWGLTAPQAAPAASPRR